MSAPSQRPSLLDLAGEIGLSIYGRVEQSVERRTPFLSEDTTEELVEDVAENVIALLKSLFTP